MPKERDMKTMDGTKIDVDRVERAMQDLDVRGDPRPRLIEEAIQKISEDGSAAMIDGYLGIKNYAHFGDQRADCKYGYGPKHGNIVFRIGRVRHRDVELGADHVYLLECVRDFGVLVTPPAHFDGQRGYARHDDLRLNLLDVIRRRNRLRKVMAPLDQAISDARVEAHDEGE